MKNTMLITVAIVLAGCSVHTTPHAENLGLTVEHMVREQTYDLEAATTNKVVIVDETDGERINNAISTYRNDTPDEGKITEPLRIEILD